MSKYSLTQKVGYKTYQLKTLFMRELTLEKMENTLGGKFWGSDSGCGGCSNGFKTCWSTYYIFWMNTGYEYEFVGC